VAAGRAAGLGSVSWVFLCAGARVMMMSGGGEGLTGIFESLAKPLGRSIGDFGAWNTTGMESDRDDALGSIICFVVRRCKVWGL